ncbi:MAG: OmpH family outer membrane protein [Bacteroidia bacterium]|nr:OmpH family outer membrane protein [Bacteroidia bacterium]NND52869.1 OmpH family outer membrane protein [Flavobacteriaceae bacterium]
MKTKVLFLLTLMTFISLSSFAQRSIRIGYIDTEYILQNVPEYQDASSQLDAKVLKWKNEIEQRLSKVEQQKQQLNSESVLLTKELVEERQEEIDIEESEILDYQQKRFGPNGDLMIQKRQLMQPVQDQIFTAVQEIAANKNYDFVFDKSADVVMLYSADRFDISEQVLRSITRSSKRRQAQNKQERKAAEKEDIIPEINLEKEEREKALEDKKATRAAEIEAQRKLRNEAREAKKAEIEAKRQKILEDRAKAREEKLKEREQGKAAVKDDGQEANDDAKAKEGEVKDDAKTKSATETAKAKTEKKLSEKEARKKALEEKKKKIIEAREKARKEKLEGRKKAKDSTDAKKDNDN